MKRFAPILLAYVPTMVLGATYKCVDHQGSISYSQTAESGKRCAVADLPPVQVIPAQTPVRREGTGAESASGAKPDQPTEKDLAEAKRALEEARKKLAEQESVRSGDEKNYQRVQERLKPFQDEVAKAEERLRKLQQGGTP